MNPLIKKYYNQIIYGQYEKPVLNSDRIFKVKHLVALISEFLDDNEVLCLIQVNNKYINRLINNVDNLQLNAVN